MKLLLKNKTVYTSFSSVQLYQLGHEVLCEERGGGPPPTGGAE